MSSAEEPLISRQAAPSQDPDPNDETTVHEDVAAAASPTIFIYLLTFSAGISGLLFGYDTGVISSTLVSLGTSLSSRELTALDKSIITSSTSLLALLVSPFASLLADRLGRRRVVLATDAVFAAGSAVQTASTTVAAMVLGRAVVGAAVGAASFVVPLYVAELAPAAFRGRLLTVNVVFITLGQVVAYVVGWALREYGDERTAWRWMVGLGALPAVVQAVVIAFMPETPRWLVLNSLMYFSATIFTMVGFPIPTLTSLVVAVTNFAFTIAALFLIDRIGRRRILLWSIPFMIAGLLLAAWGFSFIKLSTTDSAPAKTPADGAAAVILVSIMVYVAGYAMGLGNVPWMQSELFALNVRSLGSGIATATNWGANFVIGLTFLLLMDAFTPSWTFVLYAVICATGYGLIWRFYPETAGLSLEEAASLLEDDNWGVR
ncbi:a8328e12-8b4f-42c1-b5d9-58cfc13603cf [Thermothielavioides terrestris]|uniref:A8328e12-8b4f-42c1-b5d9-58cfc13603cf n=1 Tax=Thermothielavioides terrestris TaxID=2587410 RepID=A0A446BYB6_9PEZI|nr:a8328e12-8b4f-42c1-b5d9-58cfc13603cf [Thermothielavioides terrestris]